MMERLRIILATLSAVALLVAGSDVSGQGKPAKPPSGGTPPILMALELQGSKVLLKTNRPAGKIILLEGTRSLVSFPGQGKTVFDITAHLLKMEKGKLTVRASDEEGSHQKTFDVAAQVAKLKKAQGGGAPSKPPRSPKSRSAEADSSAPESAATEMPLQIDKIYLDGRRIAVLLSNPKGADLRNIDFVRGTLTIEGPGLRGSYPLTKIDPLRNLGRMPFRIEFTSPLVPRFGGSVAAVLQVGEARETAKTTLPAPPAPETLTTAGIGEGLIGDARKRNKGGGPAPGDLVPRMLEGAGLMITAPVRGDAFVQGETINLTFRFNPDVEPLPVTEVSILDGDSAAVHTVTAASGLIPPPAREMSIPVPIPADLPSGLEYTVALRTAGEPYGRSDAFRIGLFIVGPLTMLTPGGVQVNPEGGTRTRHSGETFNVTLVLTAEEASSFYQPSAYYEGVGFLMGIREPGVAYEQLGLWWLIPPRDLVRSEDGRRLTIPVTINERLAEGDGYVISYAHGDGVHYGNSLPFRILPAGAVPGEMHVSSPAAGDVLRTGSAHQVRWTYYDRTSLGGLTHRLELRRDRMSTADELGVGAGGDRRGRGMMMTVDSVDARGDCSPDAGGNLRCSASYTPGSGESAQFFSMRSPDHNYRIRVKALSGGDVAMEDESPRFTVLNAGTVGDFRVGGLRVTEAGVLEAQLGVWRVGSFSRPVPVSIDRGYQPNWTVEVPVGGIGEFSWVALGPIANFTVSADADNLQGIIGVRINEPQEFYEEQRDNNRGEARLPLRTNGGAASVSGSYAMGSTIYYQDYERDWTGKRWCCESVPLLVMMNLGYQTVTGRVEIRQVGRWAEPAHPGELAVPADHNVVILDREYTFEPGETRRLNFLQSPRPAYKSSTIVIRLHGGLAHWISPNPKVYQFEYRDVY